MDGIGLTSGEAQLLIAKPDDLHAHAIYWALNIKGSNPLWPTDYVEADKAFRSASISFDPGKSASSTRIEFVKNISSVLFRGTYETCLPTQEAHSHSRYVGEENFVQGEWRNFICNIESIAESTRKPLLVNSPFAASKAQNKAFQLDRAAKSGLLVPPTLISANPSEIRRFCAKHKKVIYKPMSPFHVIDKESGEHLCTPATLVEDIDLMPDESLSCTPGIFQKYVYKKSDLRVTVIGLQLYACEIRNSSKPQFIDWRMQTEDLNCRFVVTSLNRIIREKILKFMHDLNLVSGSLDFAIGDDGDVWFLEVNEAGQFLFLERRCPELTLLNSMASMLISGNPARLVASEREISYHDYLNSESYDSFRSNPEK